MSDQLGDAEAKREEEAAQADPAAPPPPANRKPEPRWRILLRPRVLWSAAGVVTLCVGIYAYSFGRQLLDPILANDRKMDDALEVMERAKNRDPAGDPDEWKRKARLKFAVTPAPTSPDDAIINVICDTWGWVSIDGKQVGTCPMSPVHVTAGDHEIKLGDDFKSETRTVTTVAGETVTVDLLGATKAPPLPPGATPPPTTKKAGVGKMPSVSRSTANAQKALAAKAKFKQFKQKGKGFPGRGQAPQ